MKRTATREAIGHLTRGLEVLSSQPASTERDRQELTLQSVLGSAMMYSHGWASQEAAQCYARARELCLKVGDDRELFPILFGFWMIHASRTELQEWRRTAAEMLQIARRHGDDAMLVQAHHASWGNPFQGDFLSQIGHVEQALKVYDRAEHSPLASQYGGHDAGVCGHGHKGIALWATGYPEQAAEAFFAARTLADQIAHPATLVHALGFSGWEQIFRNNWRETIRVLEEGIEIHKNSGSPQQRGRLHVMSGWARVALGDTAEGLKALRHGIAHERPHQSFGSGTLLAFNAEALRLAGLTAEALSAIDEAMPLMEERGERLWEANVHSLKGVLLLVQSSTQHADAEACFRTAIDIARDQSAKMWELRAVTRLARLRRTQGKSSEARDLLAPIYGWFTEGFDTADLKEAKALLDELS
jgi:predicted ATPase